MTWLRKSVLRWPWLYVALAAVLTLITASLIPRLQFDASITSMIPDDDPVLAELLEVTEEFGSQELFAVALRAEDVYTPAVLQKIHRLAQEIEALPGVSQVDSPLSAQMIESGFFGIDIRPVADGVPQSPEEIEAFRADFAHTPYAGRLITTDGRAQCWSSLSRGVRMRSAVVGKSRGSPALLKGRRDFGGRDPTSSITQNAHAARPG